MTDHKKLPPPPSQHLPAPSPASTPTVSLSALPSSASKIFGGPVSRLRADTELVRASSDNLEAKAEQAQKAKLLVDARIALALKGAELQILSELMSHEYFRGRNLREHDNKMLTLTHQTAELNATIALRHAQQALAALEPQPAEPPAAQPPPTPPRGLTAAQAVAAVNEIAMHMPEMTAEAREHLVLLLSGYFSEKSK